MAARWLEARGWSILGRNVREGRREIDLVVSRGPVVAFVEVKSRSGDGFGHPAEAVTWRKRREIRAVAREWLRKNPESGEIHRFDVIAVWFRPGTEARVEHLEDAWRG